MRESDGPPLAPMLRKLNFLGRFSLEDERAILALPHTLKTIPAHGYIVREGDAATHSCLLRSGFAYRQKVVSSGLRQICSIHLAGDLVDLQNSLLICADHSVQALNKIDVAFIPREAILEIAYARPEVGKAMWFDTLVDAAIFREWTTNIGRRDARARIAHILCEFGARLDAAGLRTDDIIRIDIGRARCDALVSAEEIERRKAEGIPPVPTSNTPWEEIYREKTGQLETGGVLEMALKYRRISQRTPRHNH